MNDFEQFSLRIKKDPDDLEAWKGIFEVVNDPETKSDCQKQIDRIIAKQKATPIVCPQCGGDLTVYFAGELQDKRAKCSYCGTELDIPDTYARTMVETRTGFGQFLPDTNVTVFERRTDNNGTTITSDEINQLIMEKGLIAARQELEARGLQGLKIGDVSGVDKSSEADRILDEEGVKALAKVHNVIVLTPQQVNLIIKAVILLFILSGIVPICIFLIEVFFQLILK